MSSGPSRIKVEPPGDAPGVRFPRGPTPVTVGSELELRAHGDEGAVLLSTRAGVTGYLAGSLSSLSLAEVIGQVVSGVRTGVLTVSYAGGRRKLRFRDGQLVFASSTEPHEKLGAALVNLGLVDPEALLEALGEVQPGRKLGQVLVGRHALTEAQLYSGMTFLVREIALDVFEVPAGDFLFLEGDDGDEDALKLPERTRELVLEGMKRAEELGRLRAKLPATLRLQRGPGAEPGDELVARAGSGATVGELRSAFQGSDYSFLSRVLDLVTSSALVEVQAPRAAEQHAGELPARSGPVETYRALVQRIARALLENGHTLAPLRSLLVEPLPQFEQAFAGVTIADDGRLDVERVLENFAGPKPPLARARAYEALDSFVSYALFSAKNVLSAEESARLQQDVRALRREGGTR